MVTKKIEKKEQKVWIKKPKNSCSDKQCPFHGILSVHGREFVGKVISNVFHKTVTIEFPRQFHLPKYERYEKRRTRIKAHVPPCLSVEKGVLLRIIETRPISKTKNFVAVEVMTK